MLQAHSFANRVVFHALALAIVACCSIMIADLAVAQDSANTEPTVDTSVQPADETKAAAQKPGELVPLMHDYDEAIEKAAKLDRPLLVILGAEWCGPCKVLETELAKPIAEGMFCKWAVVKVDIDEEPGLAREWEVKAVPAFRILGVDQEVLASNEGFGGLKKLQAWLDEQYDSANPRTQRLFVEDQPLDAEIAKELIALLRDRKVAHRKAAMQKLGKNLNLTVTSVIQSLQNGNLSQKICSLEILENWKAPVSGIDPWDAESLTEDRLKQLIVWQDAKLSVQNGAATDQPSTNERSAKE